MALLSFQNLPEPNLPKLVVKRAEAAMLCAPFRLSLFQDMAERGIALRTAWEQKDYLRQELNFISVENQLLWLIQVGILRREVDGQGITDSFRLTPLGHSLLAKWKPQGELAEPTWRDRLENWWTRWRPRQLF
jgi:hypothetical protein